MSGVVFKVEPWSVKRSVDGKPVYFCCESCATYFDKYPEQITTARKLGSSG